MKTKYTWLMLISHWIMILGIREDAIPQPPGLVENVGIVQSHLTADEVFLTYQLTDSSAQVSAIAKESTFFTVQSLDQLFWCSLTAFRKKLKSAEPDNFTVPGEILYLFLIEPVRSFLNGRHRLIIVPDERLTGLPFEAFIRNDCSTAVDNSAILNYLVRDFEVIYHDPAEGWNESDHTDPEGVTVTLDDSRFSFMGFSPAFDKNLQLEALPGARSEIGEICALFRQKGLPASMVLGECSQKEFFSAIACRGRIVHLATHCIPDQANDKPGGFLFSACTPRGKSNHLQEALLTMDDLKMMKPEADLLVLNGCASSGARLKAGILKSSLTRLFLRAGVRNILSTLWNVTDQLAKEFMLDFYRSWLSGKTYSEALRDVKLQWINRRETAMPTVWAPYVLTGR